MLRSEVLGGYDMNKYDRVQYLLENLEIFRTAVSELCKVYKKFGPNCYELCPLCDNNNKCIFDDFPLRWERSSFDIVHDKLKNIITKFNLHQDEAGVLVEDLLAIWELLSETRQQQLKFKLLKELDPNEPATKS